MGIGQRIRKHRTMAMVRVREYRAARFSLRSSSSCAWRVAVVVVAPAPGISSRSTWAAAATSVSSTLRIASMVL